MSGFTVAIVGRPNVGKSTFFNRLLEQRKAIVDDVSGVTRDRQYGVAEWIGKSFNLIDTGGFVPESDDVFEREIKKQVLIALEEANALIFMVDAATGITTLVLSQALINFAVVLGMVPTKGIPLPFVSYGGSSLLVMLLATGVLLNISQQATEA